MFLLYQDYVFMSISGMTFTSNFLYYVEFTWDAYKMSSAFQFWSEDILQNIISKTSHYYILLESVQEAWT